jgi:hypothetical protein
MSRSSLNAGMMTETFKRGSNTLAYASVDAPSPALKGTLSPSDGERDGVRGRQLVPWPTPFHHARAPQRYTDHRSSVTRHFMPFAARLKTAA